MLSRTVEVLFEEPTFIHADDGEYMTFEEMHGLLQQLPPDWPVWIEENAFWPGESEDAPWVYRPDLDPSSIARGTHWTVGTFLQDTRGRRGEVSFVVDVGNHWEALVPCVTLYHGRVYLRVDLLRQIDDDEIDLQEEDS